MDLDFVEEDIVRATVTHGAVDAVEGEGYLEELKDRVLTYGGVNTDCLADAYEEAGMPVERNELCPADDDSLGLRMPEVWYLNRGADAISIAQYYGFIELKEEVKEGVLSTRNTEIMDLHGKIGMVEVYEQESIEQFLDEQGMDYFGTTHTLAECMRVLEGWDVERVPRLQEYVEYAEFIESWAEEHFEGFDPSKWHLGKEESELLFKQDGTTNVREAIRQFWQRYLQEKDPVIAEDDVEVVVTDPRFAKMRSPDYVFVGEDFLDPSAEDAVETQAFDDFSGDTVEVPVREERDGRSIELARFAREAYPDATVVVMQYDEPGELFPLVKTDEEKFAPDETTFHVAKVLKALMAE